MTEKIELTPDARAILEAGRDVDGGPGDLARTRVRRSLLAKAAAGSGPVLAELRAAASSSGTQGLSLGAILVPIAVVIAGAVGGSIGWRVHHRSAPAPLQSVAPAASVAPILAPVPAPTPLVRPKALLAAPPAHRVRALAPVRSVVSMDHLAEETALLAAANGKLRDGEAERALTLLDEYDRLYPLGVLREEVLATRVIARCRVGSVPVAGARRAADAFLVHHPQSPLASRVRSSCGR